MDTGRFTPSGEAPTASSPQTIRVRIGRAKRGLCLPENFLSQVLNPTCNYRFMNWTSWKLSMTSSYVLESFIIYLIPFTRSRKSDIGAMTTRSSYLRGTPFLACMKRQINRRHYTVGTHGKLQDLSRIRKRYAFFSIQPISRSSLNMCF